MTLKMDIANVAFGDFWDSQMKQVNAFSHYKQEENHFTNGLISLLDLSTVEDPEFLNVLLKDVLKIDPPPAITTFKVLQEMNGSTADAELSGPDVCFRFETKIVSGTLDEIQVRDHWTKLKNCPGQRKLFLLTPDDGTSQYIDRFVAIDREAIQHLEWKAVSTFLTKRFEQTEKESVFSRLVQQYNERIRNRVFQQDIAGVIFKISFDKASDVLKDAYIEEMRSGKWTEWNTPRECRHLDGTGRKLILYDCTRNAITLEVEIKSVKKTCKQTEFPWTNEFVVGTVRVFDPPISLSTIRSLEVFKNLGKERSPYRVINQEQYRQLMAGQNE